MSSSGTNNISGCEAGYYRVVIKCLRITGSWIDLLSTLILMISTVLNAIVAVDNSYSTNFNIAAAALTGIAAALKIWKHFSVTDQSNLVKLLNTVNTEDDPESGPGPAFVPAPVPVTVLAPAPVPAPSSASSPVPAPSSSSAPSPSSAPTPLQAVALLASSKSATIPGSTANKRLSVTTSTTSDKNQ